MGEWVCLLKSICIIRLNPQLFLGLLCVYLLFLFSRGINWPIVILVAYYMCKWCSQVDVKWNTLEFYVAALHVRWCFAIFCLKICRCVVLFFFSFLSCIMSSFFAVCVNLYQKILQRKRLGHNFLLLRSVSRFYE